MKKILSKLTVALFTLAISSTCLMATPIVQVSPVVNSSNEISSRKIDVSGEFHCPEGKKTTLKSDFKVGATFSTDHNAFNVKINPTTSDPYYYVEISNNQGWSYTTNNQKSSCKVTVTNCAPDDKFTVNVYSYNNYLSGSYTITSYIN